MAQELELGSYTTGREDSQSFTIPIHTPALLTTLLPTPSPQTRQHIRKQRRPQLTIGKALLPQEALQLFKRRLLKILGRKSGYVVVVSVAGGTGSARG